MLPHVHNFIKDAIWILFTSRTYHLMIMTYRTLNKKCFLSWFSISIFTRRKKRKKLVIFCWMFGHVSFESIGPATWVTALWTLVWFFSSVNAETAFQMSCLAEWAPALFTVMWLLSRVGEQVLGKVRLLDCRVVAPFGFMWLFKGMCFDVNFKAACIGRCIIALCALVWLLPTVGEYVAFQGSS